MNLPLGWMACLAVLSAPPGSPATDETASDLWSLKPVVRPEGLGREAALLPDQIDLLLDQREHAVLEGLPAQHVKPPSTTIVCPVMNAAEGEANHRAACATSSATT